MRIGKRALAALKASIAAYEKRRDFTFEQIEHAEANKWDERNAPGRSGCPLCTEFYPPFPAKPCVGCPVSRKTGYDGCYGTPYQEARYAWDQVLASRGDKLDMDNWKARAQEEINFLRSLLPKGEK